MSHPARRIGVLFAASVVTAGILAAPGSAGAAPVAGVTPASTAGTDSTPSRIAANWLEKELTDGLMVGSQGTDYGLTVDAGLAMANVNKVRAVNTINAALEPKIADYIGDGTKESYAGPVAKTAAFARAARKNVTSYGGVNLVTTLEERVADADAGVTAGRISDKSEHGDYANVVGQTYAVRALTLAGSSEAGTARDFLLKQQCTSGYFRLNFDKPTSETQGCVEGAAGSEVDPDATALAVINLVGSGDNSPAVTGAIDRAADWLVQRQRPSGAFRGGTSTKVINSNTTALAGYALGITQRRDAAMKAGFWLRARQPIDRFKCRTALTRDTGAVAYRQSAVGAARTGGISKDARDEWRRTTAQAVLGLQWAPARTEKLRVEGRARGQAGKKVQFRVFGLAPGERGCIQVKGQFKRVMGKRTGGKVARGLKLPAGNRNRTITVKVEDQVVRTKIRVRN
jgi:hypothetical protein